MSWSNSLILRRIVDAVGVGQPVVEQDEVDALGKLLQRGASGLGLEHLVPFRLEALGQRPADQGFVVDDENRGFGHDYGVRERAPVDGLRRRRHDRQSQVLRYSRRVGRPMGFFSRAAWNPANRLDRPARARSVAVAGGPCARSAGRSGCGRPRRQDARLTPPSRRRGATTHAAAGRAVSRRRASVSRDSDESLHTGRSRARSSNELLSPMSSTSRQTFGFITHPFDF